MADPQPFSTAAQLRARPIIVTVPSEEDEPPVRISCRRPDPLVLFTSDLLPLEIYAAVAEKVTGPLPEFSRAAFQNQGLYGDFMDRWVCAAAVDPVVVFTAEEASDAAIWVQDLAPEIRVAIFMRTNDRLASTRVIAAVTDFRRHQSVDPDPGSDGAPVRDPAVESLVGG